MTDLGKLLVELPIDPQLGKMILVGMTLKCLEPAIIIACCSAYKEPCKKTIDVFVFPGSWYLIWWINALTFCVELLNTIFKRWWGF